MHPSPDRTAVDRVSMCQHCVTDVSELSVHISPNRCRHRCLRRSLWERDAIRVDRGGCRPPAVASRVSQRMRRPAASIRWASWRSRSRSRSSLMCTSPPEYPTGRPSASRRAGLNPWTPKCPGDRLLDIGRVQLATDVVSAQIDRHLARGPASAERVQDNVSRPRSGCDARLNEGARKRREVRASKWPRRYCPHASLVYPAPVSNGSLATDVGR